MLIPHIRRDSKQHSPISGSRTESDDPENPSDESLYLAVNGKDSPEKAVQV